MTKKLIYFTAGAEATSAELADIAVLDTLKNPGYTVAIRNGSQSASYGYGIEACDLVAGTVPVAFNAKTTFGTIDTLKPVAFDLYPRAHTMAALATKQLTPIDATGTDISNLVLHCTDETKVTYVSSVPGKATVSADGLVTGVATGVTVITATYTYTGAKTVTATTTITIS